jgi:redox-sensitive bicupin YhaK (pirin superfamily)
MSFFRGQDPEAGDRYACDALEAVVVPRSVDLGEGFAVRRALPHTTKRTVGPFVFFDHFGPAEFKSGHGLDVRPHPHIGLSTLTYLYDGEIIHRDNLGVKAAIHPGAVNWMTAGRGIVHSERTAPDHRRDGEPLHGLQFWVGMPSVKEEIEASFAHLDGDELPVVTGEGKTARIVAGTLFGQRSQLATVSETLFADVTLEAGAVMPLDAECEERGIYVVAGEIDISGDTFGPGRLLVFRPTDRITVKATQPSRIAVIGGATLDGPRHVWWNFVSSRKERIEQAKNDWRAGKFAGVPGDEIEFIPLPENRGYTAGG